MKQNAYVAGVAMTPFGKHLDQSLKSLASEAVLAALKDANVDIGTIRNFHTALKLVGGIAWDNNAAAKEAGEKRVLALFPPDPLVSWESWKNTEGVFSSM